MDTSTETTADISETPEIPETSETPDILDTPEILDTPDTPDILDTPAEPPPYWPDDWRENYAKGDPKILNRLKRFDSPKAAIDSFFAADKKLSSGLHKMALPDNATPEQLAEWRSTAGIPDSAAGYLEHLALNDGLLIGDDDAPIVGEFLETAHEANMTPAQVSRAINWFFETQEAQAEQQRTSDDANRARFDDELRQEWGTMYRRNLAAVKGLLAGAPEEVSNGIIGGRLADGTPIGNHPATLRWLANLAMEINPAATVVPGAGTNSVGQIESEIAAIEKRMGGDKKERDAYFKDEAAQARYRDLITARDRIGARR